MADKEKRSLREFLRHINDYTYRFDPEKGRFRYRELRGVRDTAFDFYMWLKCWKDMVVFVAKCRCRPCARCFATSGLRPI